MVDNTFKRAIDNQLDRIGDHTDRIIDANDLFPNPERIAKEAEKDHLFRQKNYEACHC